MALAKFLKSFTAGPVRNFRSGNSGVSALLCISDFCIAEPDAGAKQRVSDFQNRHNLSNEEFMSLADVLSSDLNVARKLTGSRYYDYEQHVDYKLRRSNLPRLKTAPESLQNLRSQYNDFETALCPGNNRVSNISELLYIFNIHGSDPDVSTWGNAEFNSVLKNINDLENEWNQKGIQHQEMFNRVFDNMRQDLKEDPFNFVVDGMTFLKTQMALFNADNYSETEIDLIEEKESKFQMELSQEYQARELNNLANTNMSPLRVYNNEDENFSQVLDAETLPVTRRFIHQVVGTGVGLGYLYVMASGVGTYTFLAGAPLVGLYWAHMTAPQWGNDATEVVKDIYLRKEDNKLDIYFWKRGEYTRVLEGVDSQNLEICEGNTVVNSFENVPFMVNEKSLTLNELRKKGLPAGLCVVNINGKSHFMHQNYRLNKKINNTVLNVTSS